MLYVIDDICIILGSLNLGSLMYSRMWLFCPQWDSNMRPLPLKILINSFLSTGLGVGTCRFGFDSLDPSQVCWSKQQSCNNILLHVYMEGNLSDCKYCRKYFVLVLAAITPSQCLNLELLRNLQASNYYDPTADFFCLSLAALLCRVFSDSTCKVTFPGKFTEG